MRRVKFCWPPERLLMSGAVSQRSASRRPGLSAAPPMEFGGWYLRGDIG